MADHVPGLPRRHEARAPLKRVPRLGAEPGQIGHHAAHTVMFRREAGYDPDNADWFWVKYLPDGSLDKNPSGTPLAGRVGKGMDEGCIACHAGVEDYVFTSDHLGEK
ncbi:MAG: hypothetical protein HLUCCO07_05865 [Rhodobacteraceae bacterium HLUCCO07]|nr:MAG: hypothetical protein HLUCCO07_05865 [Rhodobacteraceae bacterium HLUCCO07]